MDNLLSFVDAIRKRPGICRDNHGFVVNAVLFPYFLSALEFLETGNTIEEIDKAFVQSACRWGRFGSLTRWASTCVTTCSREEASRKIR